MHCAVVDLVTALTFPDLSSMDSIDEFAEEFREKETRLDILINNAGVMAVPNAKTKVSKGQ